MAYTDDGQRNCLKHVEFYCKNKFEKLVHPVGFIIRIIGQVVIYTVHVVQTCNSLKIARVYG